MSIVSVSNLSVRYGTHLAVNDASFVVEPGDFIGLAGPNGAGKTTLIKTILGLTPPTSGSVTLFDKSLSEFSQWSKIGYLPQGVSTNPLFPATVEEVVLLGLLSEKRWPKFITRADRKRVEESLAQLNITHLAKNSFNELSGGQRQRVVLARTLMQQPELLIFDEPSTALDPEARDDFFQLLEQLNTQKGITIIFITHDTAYIQKYAGKILYFDRSIRYFGSVSDFFQSEEFHDREKEYHIHYTRDNHCL